MFGSRSVLEDYAQRILALVDEKPDRTLDELVAAMHKRRIPGSRGALWQFLDRHGITFKKSLRAAEQHRADVARQRRWIRQQGFLDMTRLMFIDETAISINMVRLRGRCPRAERLIGHVPQGEWKTITFLRKLAMRNVNLVNAKAHLSTLVERAAVGDIVRITRRGKRVAQITAVQIPHKRIDVSAVRVMTTGRRCSRKPPAIRWDAGRGRKKEESMPA